LLIHEQAEKALDWFVARLKDPRKQPFGKLLGEQGMMLERVARSRIEIDAARLAVLNAAMKIDMGDAKSALKEIAEVKVQVPAMLLNVLDRAMQAHGAGGLSQDTPLPKMWAGGRTMRVVDGPDEVHMLQLAKNEIKRGSNLLHHFKEQAEARSKLCERYGVSSGDVLELNRISGKANL
jgi:acyl-CoA dehydrogenase